ncbi:MAG: peptide-methionine (R)-S-oxide reductase MsrB [bacterium]
MKIFTNIFIVSPLFSLITLSAVEITATATFAGGCFWCMEPPFEKLPGVRSVQAGYIGGKPENAVYEQVCSGDTGHFEAVQIVYDPKQVSYEKLLEVFWENTDPTDDRGQFVDRGSQYRTAIFYHNDKQRRIAEQSRADLDASALYDRSVKTEIRPFTAFHIAEKQHQNYHRKNPVQYRMYKEGSGRASHIRSFRQKKKEVQDRPSAKKSVYVKPSDAVLRKKLTELQYNVTQKGGTEPPFQNRYYKNTRAGIYVDVVTGEPLFSSLDKYHSGSGWPSFTRPIDPDNIKTQKDRKLFTVRTEVRSSRGKSHLGHVFNDGPLPTGKRWCINSAALKFIPVSDLEKEGYGEYLKLFKPESFDSELENMGKNSDSEELHKI